MHSPIMAWRNQKHHYRLEGIQCSACKKIFFPKVYLCTCGGKSFVLYRLNGRGTIVSFTHVTAAGSNFESSIPYTIALIDLDEGVRILGQLTDIDEGKIVIGARVTSVFRRLSVDGSQGIIHYGTKFLLDQV